MGNIIGTIRRFFGNKNTVTIIGVILGLVVLFIGYNYRVNHAIDTIQIPYAKKTINATEEITQENVGMVEVLRSLVSTNKTMISSKAKVLSADASYCVTTGTSIPAGGFFYNEQIDNCRNISNNPLKRMPDGYRPVSLPVNLHTTYGNSMMPDDYIDLYVRMNSEDGKLIYGQLVEKLPILDVRDSNGKSVFATSQTTTPAELLFAVPNEQDGYNLYLLLSKASYLSNVTLVPVPGNATYTQEVGETKVTSQYLMNEILRYTQDIPDEVVQ